jgi:hypothetical protein
LPTLNIVETDGVPTMSSLQMVDYINASRTPGQAELLHKTFLAKVPTVLGYKASAEFSAHVFVSIGNGAERRSPIYNFPEEEAMLMAMSYSYKRFRFSFPGVFSQLWEYSPVLGKTHPGEHGRKTSLMLPPYISSKIYWSQSTPAIPPDWGIDGTTAPPRGDHRRVGSSLA